VPGGHSLSSILSPNAHDFHDHNQHDETCSIVSKREAGHDSVGCPVSAMRQLCTMIETGGEMFWRVDNAS
jgi:hypothetical protein